MKDILYELITRFYRREVPALTSRTTRFPVVEGKATVLVGMRRSGKTYRCYQRMHELLNSGIPLQRLLYLNFEDERLKGFNLGDCQKILDVYYELYPNNRDVTCYFFFDEIQNVPEWELFIRRVIDSEKIQITLTGSSSKMLTDEIATAMRGRSMNAEILPFSFEEFIRYHKYMEEIPQYLCDIDRSKVKHALNQYFQWGGFPEVQKTEEPDRDRELQEYFTMVLAKDVKERYKVSNDDALNFTAQFIFNAIAERVTISGIFNHLSSLGIKSDWEAVKSYVKYLCDAFLFYPVPIHTRSLSQQRRNPTKYYAVDIGMVRAMSLSPDGDKGHLLENLVFLHLHRNGWILEYVVTRSGNKEIDFYAYHRISKEKMLIQVSYTLATASTLDREVSAFTKAADYLEASKRFIVTWDEETILGNDIKVIPAWKFLLDRY